MTDNIDKNSLGKILVTTICFLIVMGMAYMVVSIYADILCAIIGDTVRMLKGTR